MAIILITGCSSGFGMLSAARLAAGGHTVYATMRNLGKKDRLLAEADRRGAEVRILPLDVTDDASIVKVVEQIKTEEGRLDILVNNAGFGITGFFEDLTEEEIRDQMETNYFGLMKVTRHALPLLRETAAQGNKQTSVKIINISSTQGQSALPGLGAYSTSKFAVEGFSESLYMELRPFGIHVVLIQPGSFGTDIFTANRRDGERVGDPASPYALLTKNMIAKVEAILKSPVAMGDPEDVAKLVEKTVNRRDPRLRYMVATSFGRLRATLQPLMPFRWYAAIVCKTIFGKAAKNPYG